MTLKGLAKKLDKLADEMQAMFDEMTTAQYDVCDSLSLAVLQGDLYSVAEEIREEIGK